MEDIGNIWSVCLGIYVLIPSSYFALHLAADNKKEPSLKGLITFSLKIK